MCRNGDGLVMIDGTFNYKWQYFNTEKHLEKMRRRKMKKGTAS